MKNTLLFLFATLAIGNAFAQPSGLIINEFSQGSGGTKEFMEFVVIGQRTCSDSTIDLRGWIFDDHNGWYTGAGSAQGSKRFSNSSNWSHVPVGSIILVYNDGDKNGNITQPDDPTDANNDLVYILPVSSSYIEGNSQPPSGGGGATFTYPTSGWGSSGSWASLGLNNSGDAVISVDPNNPGTAFHSIIYSYSPGSGQTPVVALTQNVSGNHNCYLNNGSYTSSTAYIIGNAGTSTETPGTPNSAGNITWINSLRNPTGGGVASRDTINKTICQGKTYTFNGNTYSTSGFYTAIYTNSTGCDSLIVLNLNVTNGLSVSITKTDVSCYNGNNGTATAIATGGTTPYIYTWHTNPDQVKNPATNLSAGTYKVTIVDDIGCEATDSVTIGQPQEMTLTLKEDKQTCPGTASGQASVSVKGGYAPLNIAWTTTPAQSGPVANNLEEGVYTVSVTDAKGCLQTGTISITPYKVNDIIVSADKTVICSGDNVQLNASGMNQYKWSPSSGLSCSNCSNPLAKIDHTTTYTVVGEDVNGCKDTGSIMITLLARTTVSVGPEVVICTGGSAQLSASGGEQYSWTPEFSLNNGTLAKPVAIPANTTTYQVVIKENECYTDTLFQKVSVYPIPTVNAGPDIKGLPGAEFQLNARVTDAAKIEWFPKDDLSCAFCADPYVKLRNTITYKVTVTSPGGCYASDEITVTATCDGSELFMPNTFTPNGDGQNDYFYPQGSGIGTVKRFKVMNSWGQIVYQVSNISANNPLQGWDGTFNGEKLSADVFVYMVELGCASGQNKIITGDITLIR